MPTWGAQQQRTLTCLSSLVLCVVAVPRIASVTPSSGPGAGGFRITIRGDGLPLFPFQARVLLESGEECTRIEVVEDWRAITCVMPACDLCGDRILKVITSTGAESNGARFHYFQDCYDGPNPSLPRRYSGAENCTVCTSLVLLALASSGDLVTFATLRGAMQQACSSSLLKSWGPVDSTRCRTDLSAGCLALFHSSADTLLSGILSHWHASYAAGELPLLACRAAGQCGG